MEIELPMVEGNEKGKCGRGKEGGGWEGMGGERGKKRGEKLEAELYE